MTWGEIDGFCDAAMGLPSQPALRFCEHHVLRDDAAWLDYYNGYTAAYRRTKGRAA